MWNLTSRPCGDVNVINPTPPVTKIGPQTETDSEPPPDVLKLQALGFLIVAMRTPAEMPA
jgi:hypothetical protein